MRLATVATIAARIPAVPSRGQERGTRVEGKGCSIDLDLWVREG